LYGYTILQSRNIQVVIDGKLHMYEDIFYNCLSEVFTVVKIRMYCGFMVYGTLQSGMWAIVFLQII